MALVSQERWGSLETWSPMLFLVGFVLTLVFAVIHGAAYLVDSFSFVEWLYPTVLIGRLAVLLGVAGLSVRIANRHSRLGKLSRGVVSLAILFTTGLVTLAILETVGITTPIIAVFGIGTVLLTILTFLVFGAAGLGTDAYPSVVGGLLLIATLAVVFVLVGQGTFSTNFRGAVGEAVNASVFLAMWYTLEKAVETAETVEASSGGLAE